MNLINITARDLPDAWFQCVYKLIEKGREFKIDSGSYAGEKRLEFDYITIQIKFPNVRPLLPQIPQHLGIPNPVSDEYVEQYLPYLMTPEKKPGEDYTYGQRLNGFTWLAHYAHDSGSDGNIISESIDQIQEVIRKYRKEGFRTNQCTMSISTPSDILLKDPPCLRSIDTRIQDNKLHFFIYFRSWDLWGGFPANLAAIQLLKEYMASEIGVEDGEIIAASKGLHVYSYCFDLHKIVTYKTDKKKLIDKFVNHANNLKW